MSALRLGNEQAVLRTLLRSGPATQSELARRTKLSKGSVSSIVKALSQRGLVDTAATISSGRRATLITARTSSSRVSVGVDLGRQHIAIAVLLPGREILLERNTELAPGSPAEEALGQVKALIHASLDEVGRSMEDVASTVLALPGPVDDTHGVIVDGAINPEWVGRSSADVSAALGMEVALANDADMGAFAELNWGEGAEDFMFVKVGTGIGAGIVSGGELHTGGFGIAGEIGHTTVDPSGVLCRCGNRGCLETVSAAPVVLQYLSETLGREVSLAELGALAHETHRATLRVVADAGIALGQALASAVNLLGSTLVVVGGPLSATGDALLRPVRDGFTRFAIPSVAERTRVELSTLGVTGGARGAAAMAFERTDESAYLI